MAEVDGIHPPQPQGAPNSGAASSTGGVVERKSPVTHLNDEDLLAVRKAIGAPPLPAEGTSKTRVPTSQTPDGLFKECAAYTSWSKKMFYMTATLYNFSIVLQLLLGATLTALGSTAVKNGTAITILAAGNTVNAGVIALLHNSGLPNRLRNDWFEYERVQLYLVELMDSGVVEAGLTRDDVIQNCFKMFSSAKATVQANKPSVYTAATSSNTPPFRGSTSG